MNAWPRWGMGVAVIALAVGMGSRARADVNLELRPAATQQVIGQEFGLGLYAVSDVPGYEPFTAAEVIFSWDPTVLQLNGLSNVGAVPKLFSGFPGTDPYNLNETVPPTDGDGLYAAWPDLGQVLHATPEGALLTTFLFEAVAITDATTVVLEETGGSPPGETAVFGVGIPNLSILGDLSNATVAVVPEPGALVILFAGVTLWALPKRRRRKSCAPELRPSGRHYPGVSEARLRESAR